jgi:hypothetical protein
MGRKLKSVLTDDLGHCYVTKSDNVAIHHIFPGIGRRKLCDKYGFIVPLVPELHNMSSISVHNNPNIGLDLKLKQICQRYFEANYGGREKFISLFGRSYF